MTFNYCRNKDPSNWKKLDPIWRKACQYGILNIKCLERFPEHYVDGVFSPKELTQIFLQMCIMFKLGPDEFLMPCIMVSGCGSDVNPEPETQAVPAMVIEFPKFGPLLGTYSALICYLINTKEWKLKRNESGEICHLTRSRVHFCAPMEFEGQVTITDPLSNFFVVTFHGSPVVASQICPIISETVLSAIKEVSESLYCAMSTDSLSPGHSRVDPKLTFLCQCNNVPYHPAILSKDGEQMKCPHSVTTNHKTWIGGL